MNHVRLLELDRIAAHDLVSQWLDGRMSTAMTVSLLDATTHAAIEMNGRIICTGCIKEHPAPGVPEAAIMFDPQWTPPPVGMIRVVRALGRALHALVDERGLLVYVRSNAGRRMAIRHAFQYSHTLRINGEIIEAWRYVVVKEGVQRHDWRSLQASAGCGQG